MNRKKFKTELHKIDSNLILTVLAHQGADEIVYYDGNQKLYKVFDFKNGQYCQKGSLLLSVNQFNKLRNLLLKAQAFIRGRNTFDDMSAVTDDSHNAKKLDKAMAEVQKAYRKTGYKGKKNEKLNKNEKSVIDKILESVQQENNRAMALYFIESAILLNCDDESDASIDNHILTKIEVQEIIGRLLNKALIILGDSKMVELLKSFNDDEQNNNHDARTKLLMKLIDEEFHQMKKENF